MVLSSASCSVAFTAIAPSISRLNDIDPAMVLKLNKGPSMSRFNVAAALMYLIERNRSPTDSTDSSIRSGSKYVVRSKDPSRAISDNNSPLSPPVRIGLPDCAMFNVRVCAGNGLKFSSAPTESMLNVAVVGANGLMLMSDPDESIDSVAVVAAKKLSNRSDRTTLNVAVDAGKATKLFVLTELFSPAPLSENPFTDYL